MIQVILITLFLVLVPMKIQAEDWSKTDTTLFCSVLVLSYADYRQTIEITRDDSYHETNPLLGKYPSESEVANHFIITTVGAYLVADYLKGWKRSVFLIWAVIYEFYYVDHNISIGVTF